MFKEEARWICQTLKQIVPDVHLNKVANLGSSTEFFRKTIQPHIEEFVVNPLESVGWEVVHVDMKQEQGVQIIADVTDKDFGSYFSNKFALSICSNMLEHVQDISIVVKNLLEITVCGGYILVTVPYKYRLHLDPIDNGFRPKPIDIFNLFPPGSVLSLSHCVISINDKCSYKIKKSKFPLWGRRERFFYYLGKRYKVSGILLQVINK